MERCGKGWRARWLLADWRHRGSRCGFATKWEAKHFADAREVAEREAAARAGEPEAVEERVVSVGAWWDRWFPAQDLALATLRPCRTVRICPRMNQQPTVNSRVMVPNWLRCVADLHSNP
jgi:hypothetical protein